MFWVVFIINHLYCLHFESYLTDKMKSWLQGSKNFLVLDSYVRFYRYVTYNSWLPMHTLTAVNILLAVTSHPIKHSTFIQFFISTNNLQTTIRHGFVESLEAEENQVTLYFIQVITWVTLVWLTFYKILVISLQWSDSSELTTIGKIKEGIMKLLIQCLPAAGVNLAHYLLGFNLKNIKRTILQSPGMYNGREIGKCSFLIFLTEIINDLICILIEVTEIVMFIVTSWKLVLF